MGLGFGLVLGRRPHPEGCRISRWVAVGFASALLLYLAAIVIPVALLIHRVISP